MLGAMAKPNPILKLGGALVLATAAFLGLFGLLVWRVVSSVDGPGDAREKLS